ncbi:MAG TPA: heparinase II/III family protein [Xanthobacteraceae bacterium]|nr:heparinase II/III family protein [Xanthobacteraceae bacterium]
MSLRRGVHRTLGRLKSWAPALPTLPGRGDRLVIAPQDLRTADPTRAAEIYSGRFAFAGKVVICDGRSPFEMLEPSAEWSETLLGFGWLRHLRAADTPITRANARALVDEWINLQGSWNATPWQPEILSRRIISWLTQATLILDDADAQFYRRFLRSLTKQVQFLRSTVKDTPDGALRLQAQVALTYAALCISGQMRHLPKTTRRLIADLERQILPDGGHAGRNPGALIEILLDLLPLRQAFTARNLAPPAALINAIDRMMPMLRFFRHGDGTFGLFNGMGPTPPDLLATLIAYDDARGTPVANAVHSGYQRIEAGNTVVLMDTGRPPPVEMSHEAGAGCLSFEFSSKLQRVVVNCGLPGTAKENWREFSRSTPAHSTVTFNGASSCRFKDNRTILSGPTRVAVDREFDNDGTIVVRGSHDGYVARYSVIHQRTLVLSADGNQIDGEELFLPSKGGVIPAKIPDEFAVRFHLHPAVRATRVADGHGAMLILPNRDLWNFHTYEDVVELEDGAYLGGQDGPRRGFQLVIRGNARQAPRVRWTFVHTPQPSRAGRAVREHDPELPL